MLLSWTFSQLQLLCLLILICFSPYSGRRDLGDSDQTFLVSTYALVSTDAPKRKPVFGKVSGFQDTQRRDAWEFCLSPWNPYTATAIHSCHHSEARFMSSSYKISQWAYNPCLLFLSNANWFAILWKAFCTLKSPEYSHKYKFPCSLCNHPLKQRSLVRCTFGSCAT
jgi:hypothetical protein